MAANTDLIVTGLDFDTIRLNLRTYISSKPEFTDYDFNDSALGTLLDLLAYNTYYQAFYANMAANEGFLDTAQLYDSVVSHAKTLGYVPTSARGATANVQLIFTSSIANSTFRSIRVAKDTRFTTTVNGISYSFVTPQTYTITANSTNGFADHVNIVEGVPLTHRFVYVRGSNTDFILPNENVDTNSIAVTVTTGGNVQSYTRGDNILIANSTSQIYFVEADRNQRYKISFGRGVTGKQPDSLSVISISYRVCNGPATNGANSFSLVSSTVDGQTNIAIVPIGRASGGAAIETIDSIRTNAPRLYETQNRSVTTEDYKRIILRDNPDISTISVWGGEDNNPPIYGKVFVSMKPKTGTYLSNSRKQQIKTGIIRYNVQSIDVEVVDPTYLYIVPYINVRYDPNQTSKTPGELVDAIASRLISFETNYLSSFNNSFRYSRFLDYIDSTDSAIKTTDAQIRLRKTFNPNISGENSYTINFYNPLQRLGTKELISGVARHPGYGGITSSAFQYADEQSFFDDNGFGTLRVYYRSGSQVLGRAYTNFSAGRVDYETGTVYIDRFLPQSVSGDALSIIAAPLSPNINPVKNQILLISQSLINVVDDNSGVILASASNIETTGQTVTIQTPSLRLYNI